MWEGLEARKFPRVQAQCQIEVEDVRGGNRLTATTENIGQGGLCTVLARELPKLSSVRIKLYLTDREPPIECRGRVVWMVTKRSLSTPTIEHDTGIEFLDLTKEASGRLANAVQAHRLKPA